MWYGVPAARVAGILDGSNMSKVEISDTYTGFTGASAAKGIGYVNTPPDGAADGTIVFLTIPSPGGTMLMFR